ncbi:hypothetical protein ScalyP_jg9749, partial [Parmales sp. scaly parma]
GGAGAGEGGRATTAAKAKAGGGPKPPSRGGGAGAEEEAASAQPFTLPGTPPSLKSWQPRSHSWPLSDVTCYVRGRVLFHFSFRHSPTLHFETNSYSSLVTQADAARAGCSADADVTRVERGTLSSKKGRA